MARCGTLACDSGGIGAGANVCKGSAEFDFERGVGVFVLSVEPLVGTGQHVVGSVRLEVRRTAWVWKWSVVMV